MDLIPFAATALLLELTPGPNMVWLVLLTALHGRRAGLAAVAGVALGLLVVGLVAALGMASLVAEYPPLVTVLRWTGVAYLLWLAWESWPRGLGKLAPSDLPDGRIVRHFRDGLVLNLLNVKSALFFLLALPEFARGAGPILPQALVLVLVYVLVATAIHLVLVGMAGRAHALLRVQTRQRTIQRIGAILLALVALWLAAR